MIIGSARLGSGRGVSLGSDRHDICPCAFSSRGSGGSFAASQLQSTVGVGIALVRVYGGWRMGPFRMAAGPRLFMTPFWPCVTQWQDTNKLQYGIVRLLVPDSASPEAWWVQWDYPSYPPLITGNFIRLYWAVNLMAVPRIR
jgi:hypothetical protein